MKICYIYSNFHLSHITGQAGVMFKLAELTKKSGHQVSIISNSVKTNSNPMFDLRLINGHGDTKTYLSNIGKIKSIIKTINPDLIHVNGVLFIIYIWLLNYQIKKPIMGFISETIEKHNFFVRLLLKFVLNRISMTFVTADFIKNQLITLGVAKEKLSVVRIGLKDDFLQSFPLDNEKNDVLYYGDSNFERGFDYVCKLAKILPKVQFLILIRKEYDNCYQDLKDIRQLINVKVLNYPYKRLLIDYINESKLIVLPFRWMLIRPPISVIETMALEKCIITSNMKSNEEIVKNGHNGIVANFDKINIVADKINELLINIRKRKQLAQNARKTIIKMYLVSEYKKIINTYQNCD